MEYIFCCESGSVPFNYQHEKLIQISDCKSCNMGEKGKLVPTEMGLFPYNFLNNL